MRDMRIGEELLAGPDFNFNSSMAIVKRLDSLLFTARLIAGLLAGIAILLVK